MIREEKDVDGDTDCQYQDQSGGNQQLGLAVRDFALDFSRRLDSLKRQLLAAAGPQRRASRFREASVKLHRDGQSKTSIHHLRLDSESCQRFTSGTRSLESRFARGGFSHDGSKQADNLPAESAAQQGLYIEDEARKSTRQRDEPSPSHLIRMLAERREESGGDNSRIQLLINQKGRQLKEKRCTMNEPNSSNAKSRLATSPVHFASCGPIQSDIAGEKSKSSQELMRDKSSETNQLGSTWAASANAASNNKQLKGGEFRNNSKKSLRTLPLAAARQQQQQQQQSQAQEAERLKGRLHMLSHEDRSKANDNESKECQELRELLATLTREQDGFSLKVEPFDQEEANLIQGQIASQLEQRAQSSGNSHLTDGLSKFHELLEKRQDTFLELISTELNYIERLILIQTLFLNSIKKVQARSSLLRDVQSQQMVSNIELVLDAHLTLWTRHLRPLVGHLTVHNEVHLKNNTNQILLDPVQLSSAFTTTLHETFKPYYRFCIEQASCVAYVRRLVDTNDCFRLFLGWCEQRRECQRMRLVDMLASPMQRLTRYPLLMRALLRQTNELLMLANGESNQNQLLCSTVQLEQQRDALRLVIQFTEHFLQTINLELKRRDEFIKLIQLSDLLSLNQEFGPHSHHQWDLNNNGYNNHEIQTLLKSYASNFDSIMGPLFGCPHSCQRRILFNSAPHMSQMNRSNNTGGDGGSNQHDATSQAAELNHLFTSSSLLGPIKFKDVQCSSKTEVIIVVLTDQLLVCKHERQIKATRPADHSPKASQPRQRSSNCLNQLQSNNFYVCSFENNDRSGLEYQTTELQRLQTTPLRTHLTATNSDASERQQQELKSPPQSSEHARKAGRHLGSTNDDRWIRFKGRRAASHSFERPLQGNRPKQHDSTPFVNEPNKLEAAGYEVDERQQKSLELPVSMDGFTKGQRNGLLSPTRALVRLSSGQTLSSPSINSNNAIDRRHLTPGQRFSTSSQKHLSSASQQAAMRTNRSISNCSLSSNFDHANYIASMPNSRQQSIRRQSMSSSADEIGQRQQSTTWREQSSIHLPTSACSSQRLTLIRSPYPIERLAMHELSDGRSVLFCQLNDTKTVANSFVAHFPKSRNEQKQQCGNSSQSIAAIFENDFATPTKRLTETRQQNQLGGGSGSCSRAKLLIESVREAQMRLKALAHLHERPFVNLAPFFSLEPDSHTSWSAAGQEAAAASRLSFDETAANFAAANQHKNLTNCVQQEILRSQCSGSAGGGIVNEIVDGQRLIHLIAEEHQMFMLSHGRHSELATNTFVYELNDEHFFRVTTRPVGLDVNKSGRTSPDAVGSRQKQGWRSGRLQSDGSMRLSQERAKATKDNNNVGNKIARDRRNSYNRSSRSSDMACQRMSDGQTPTNNRNFAFDQPAGSERDIKLLCSNASISPAGDESKISQLQPNRLATTTTGANDLESISSQRSVSRRNLLSLRRQNVVLSASCEQQNLVPSKNVNCSLEGHQMSLVCLAAGHNVDGLLLVGQQNSDSSSIESTVLTTDDSCKQRSSCMSFAGPSAHGSGGSMQNANMSQTLDDCTWDQEEETARSLSRSILVPERKPPMKFTRKSMTKLQSINSVSSNDQTNSLIAITLAVPRRIESVNLEGEPIVDSFHDMTNDEVPKEVIDQSHALSAEVLNTPNRVQDKRLLLTGCLDLKTPTKVKEKHQPVSITNSVPSRLLNSPLKSLCKRQTKSIRSRVTSVLGRLHLI